MTVLSQRLASLGSNIRKRIGERVLRTRSIHRVNPADSHFSLSLALCPVFPLCVPSIGRLETRDNSTFALMSALGSIIHDDDHPMSGSPAVILDEISIG